jgi:hypothetical protein
MPEYKNQHYVPQHLLRGWTQNNRVPVYNLENKQEYPETAISNLCSEDYFYGGSEVEEDMDGLEGKHASIIKKLRVTRMFNILSDMEIRHFCVFILLQRNRTKQQKKETEDVIDNFAKKYIELQAESEQVDTELSDGRDVLDLLDEFKVTHEYPLAIPMLKALTGVDLIIDLDVAIIQNQADKGFIISDHPVVHDNRRFKDELDRFLVGLQNRGLQIFIPLSDTVQVMLYDPATYHVEYTNKEQRRVEIDSEKIVTGLNDMQLINAFENVFFREAGREEELQTAQDRLSRFIEEEMITFQELSPDEHYFETDNEIIESGQYVPEYSPYLPFVKQRMDTAFRIERRPSIRRSHREFVDELLADARQDWNEE